MEAPISSLRSIHPPRTPKTGTRKTYEEAAVRPINSMPFANRKKDKTVDIIPRDAFVSRSAELGSGIVEPQFSAITHGVSKAQPVAEYQTTISSE